jgi:hypothetical protein
MIRFPTVEELATAGLCPHCLREAPPVAPLAQAVARCYISGVEEPMSTKSRFNTVHRDGVEWEVAFRYEGRHHPATRLDPEEWPDPVPVAAMRDGVEVAVSTVPDAVIEEAAAIDADQEPTDDTPEPDDDARRDAAGE